MKNQFLEGKAEPVSGRQILDELEAYQDDHHGEKKCEDLCDSINYDHEDHPSPAIVLAAFVNIGTKYGYAGSQNGEQCEELIKADSETQLITRPTE